MLTVDELKNVSFLKDIDLVDLTEMLKHVNRIQLTQGEVLVRQGQELDRIYYINSGKCEVEKLLEDGERHMVGRAQQGELLGELAFIDEKPASVTVIAMSNVEVFAFDISFIKKHQLFYHAFLKRSSLTATARLRNINRVTAGLFADVLAEIEKRKFLGRFSIVLIIVFCIYTLILNQMKWAFFQGGTTTYASFSLSVIFALIVIGFIRYSRMKFAEFGIHLKRVGPVLRQALIYTLPVLLFLLLYRLITVPEGEHFFHYQFYSSETQQFSWPAFLPFLLYVTSCPLQELVARCGLQRSIFLFVSGSSQFRVWASIVIPNLAFATTHSHTNILFSMLAFFVGLFWGWLFSKQNSWLGVAVSHVILGGFAYLIYT